MLKLLQNIGKNLGFTALNLILIYIFLCLIYHSLTTW